MENFRTKNLQMAKAGTSENVKQKTALADASVTVEVVTNLQQVLLAKSIKGQHESERS